MLVLFDKTENFQLGNSLLASLLVSVVENSVEPIVGNLTDWQNYSDTWLLPINSWLQHLEIGVHLSVVTEWQKWGPCEACNRPHGERRRLGTCRVKPSSKQVKLE